MISLSAPLYDLEGQVLLYPSPDSELQGGSRRVSRTPTLDGGATIVDQGMSHADRTFRIVAPNISENKYNTVWYLLRTYSLVNIATRDGLYSGVIQRARRRGSDLEMTILIQEKQDGIS